MLILEISQLLSFPEGGIGFEPVCDIEAFIFEAFVMTILLS
jgi:hypothetical protein